MYPQVPQIVNFKMFLRQIVSGVIVQDLICIDVFVGVREDGMKRAKKFVMVGSVSNCGRQFQNDVSSSHHSPNLNPALSLEWST